MDSGRNCASPRLTGGRFCYWHNRLHTQHFFPGNPKYEAPILDSPNAVALAVNHVYRGQASGLIDGKTARHLLNSLRLALQAFRLLDHPLPTEMVTDIASDPDTLYGPDSAQRSAKISLSPHSCHPERGRMAESKDPATACTDTKAPSLLVQTVGASPNSCHPERGRMAESKDPATACTDTKAPSLLAQTVGASPNSCHPERGRMAESKDPATARTDTKAPSLLAQTVGASPNSCHPERGRMAESKEPATARTDTKAPSLLAQTVGASPNSCHPERGRMAESKEPATARTKTSVPGLPTISADAFSLLADSPGSAAPLAPEQERSLAHLVRRTGP